MRPIVLLVLATVTVGSCGPQAPLDPGSAGEGLLPLKVGSTWTYSIADSGASKLFPDSTGTATIVSDTVVNGQRWYKANDASLVGVASSFPWFTNAYGGTYQGAPPFVANLLAYEYPAHKGTTGVLGWTVVDTNTVVTVPAGTYHAVLIGWFTNYPSGGYRWQYIAKGTGVVKEVFVISSNNQGVATNWRVRILTSYKP